VGWAEAASDAATVLLGLNELWAVAPAGSAGRAGLPLARMCLFCSSSSALGPGGREDLQPLELPESWYVVIHPGWPWVPVMCSRALN